MTTPRVPEHELLDIMDLDEQIDALRCGAGDVADPALAMLLELRDEVDDRAAMLLGQHDGVRDASRPAVTAMASRRRLRQRLAVVPVTAALLAGSTGVAAALSSSPQAPLYPLHRLMFGTGTPSVVAQIEHDLAAAQGLLDHAAAEPYASRAGELGLAHIWLSDAQNVLPLTGPQAPGLSRRLSAEMRLLAELETPPVIPAVPAPAPTAGGSVGAAQSDGGDGTGQSAQPEQRSPNGESDGAGEGVAPAAGPVTQTDSTPTNPSPPSDATEPAPGLGTAPSGSEPAGGFDASEPAAGSPQTPSTDR